MKRIFSLAAVTLLVSMPLAAPAQAANVCKDLVTASGKASLTKVPGAYLSSLLAWRRTAEEKYGKAFRPWRHATNKKIECAKGVKDGKSGWICTRTASPCNDDAKKSVELPDGPTLERGSTGERVSILQQILVDTGYNITVDGNYGRGTRDAVMDFQRKEGIEVDGKVGPATRERLNS